MSLTRLYLLRGIYLCTFAVLAFQVWPDIVAGDRDWEPLGAIAVSLYGALSLLCLLGVRNPLAMLPLLLLQLSYKVIWILAAWLPFQLAGRAQDLSIDGFDPFVPFLFVVVADLLVIPWPYVVARLGRAQRDRWSDQTRAQTRDSSPAGVPAALQPDENLTGAHAASRRSGRVPTVDQASPASR